MNPAGHDTSELHVQGMFDSCLALTLRRSAVFCVPAQNTLCFNSAHVAKLAVKALFCRC